MYKLEFNVSGQLRVSFLNAAGQGGNPHSGYRRIRITSLSEALASEQRIAGDSARAAYPSTDQCPTSPALVSIRLSKNASLVSG